MSARENHLEETLRRASCPLEMTFARARVLPHSTIPEKNEGLYVVYYTFSLIDKSNPRSIQDVCHT